VVPAVRPRDLDPYAYSHIVYSFARVARGSWALTETQAYDKELIAELQALKKINPTLKTMWAVGGWAFNVRFFSSRSSCPYDVREYELKSIL
jgi:GH18 family chitinase